jgi:hypothetical protein
MPIVVTVHIVPAGCVFGYNLQLLLSHLRQLCSQLTPFFRKQAINMTCCTNDGMPMVVDVRFNRIRCCILCLRVVFSPQFAALAAIYPKPILTFFFPRKIHRYDISRNGNNDISSQCKICPNWLPVRCQGPNGPGGPLGLGLGIKLSSCLGVK